MGCVGWVVWVHVLCSLVVWVHGLSSLGGVGTWDE